MSTSCAKYNPFFNNPFHKPLQARICSPIRHRIDRSHAAQRRVVRTAQLVQQTVHRRPLVRVVQRRRTGGAAAVAVQRARMAGRPAVRTGPVACTAQILQQRVQLGQVAASRGRRRIAVLLVRLVLGRLRTRQRIVRRAGSRRGRRSRSGRAVEHGRWRLAVLLVLVGQRLVQGLCGRGITTD